MQSIVNSKVSYLEVYSNDKKAAHIAAEPTTVSGMNKDSKLLHEISAIIMNNTSDLHSKVESLRGVLSAQGYDIDSESAGTKMINKALAEIASLHSNIAAKNKTTLVGKPELSHLYNEVSIKLDIIKSSIRDNSIATQHQALKSKSAPPVSKDTNNLTVGTSYADLWAVIATAIGDIKTNYLDYYSGLLQKYENMYEEYNNDVQKASSEAVTKGTDSNSVAFSVDTMAGGYNKFSTAVSNMHIDDVPGWSSLTSEQKTSTINSLAPAFNVDSSGKVTFNLDQYNQLASGAKYLDPKTKLTKDDYSVLVNGGLNNLIADLNDGSITNFYPSSDIALNFSDMSPQQIKENLQKIANQLNDSYIDSPVFHNRDTYNLANKLLGILTNLAGSAFPDSCTAEKKDASTPSYQAWLATFNASGSTLQSNMNSFTQRYSQANSTYDNLNKVLSGTISSLSDAAKDVFKSL